MPNFKVVIVGMGAGGLTAAIELVRNGQQVVIFEKRDNFTRPQWVHLSYESDPFIASLIDLQDPLDGKLIPVQKDQGVKFSRVRTLQKFLYRKLQSLQKLYPDLIEIKQGKGFNITDIDPQTQTLYFDEQGQKKQLVFDHLLEADGAHHSMADLLNQSAKAMGQKPYFNFHRQNVQPRHRTCGIIQCKLNLPPQIEMNDNIVKCIKTLFYKTPHWTLDDYEGLRILSWNSPYFPEMTIYGDARKCKINLGTEIPEYLFYLSKDVKNRNLFQQKFLEWARLILFNTFEKLKKSISEDASEELRTLLQYLTPECLVILPKELKLGKTEEYVAEVRALNTTPFLLEYTGADKAFVKLGRNGSFVLIGDSFQTPYFLRMHGMNDAIAAAKVYSQSFASADDDQFINFNNFMVWIRTREINGLGSDVSRGKEAQSIFKNKYDDFKECVEVVYQYLIYNKGALEIDATALANLKNLIDRLNYESNVSTMSELFVLKNTVKQLTEKIISYDLLIRSSHFAAEALKVNPFFHKYNPVLFCTQTVKSYNNEFENSLRSFLFNNFPQQHQENHCNLTNHMLISSEIYTAKESKEKNAIIEENKDGLQCSIQ